MLLRILPIAILLVGLVVARNKRQVYLATVLVSFPFIDLRVTPVEFGGLTVFDAMTFLALPFVWQNFKYFRNINRIYLALVLALVLLLFVGAVASEFTADSLLSLLSFVSVLVYANVLLQELYDNEHALPTLLKGLNGIALLSLAWLAVQVATKTNLTFYEDLNHNVNDPIGGLRYASFFQDPQKYGQFLAVNSFLFLIRTDTTKPQKLYQLLLFFVTAMAILLTGTRSALFGLVAGFGLVLAMQSTGTKVKMGFAALVGSFILYQNMDSFIGLQRLREIDESYEWRNEIWRGAVEIWRAHPLLGIGVGNYQLNAIAHEPNQSILLDNDEILYLDQPENGYLKVLTEFGTPGFVVFVLLFIIPLLKSAQFFREKSARDTLFVLCAALVSWVIAFNSLYSIIDKRVFVLVATIICCILYNLSQLRTQQQGS
jgi:O-antigen ligase